MKNLTLRFWSLLLGWLLLSTQAWASHAAGGEILYAPLTGSADRYHITVRLFRGTEATTVDFAESIPLFCAKNGCDVASAGSFVVQLTRTKRTDPDAIRCGAVVNEINMYEGDVTLPPSRWLLSTLQENRSISIRNISLSDSHNLHIESFLDNSSGLVNSSPKFTTYKLPYLSSNQAHQYSSSAFDIDGDSLVYQVAAPRENKAAAIQQFGCSNEISFYIPAPNFTVDAATGALRSTSAAVELGDYVMPIRVDEYRKLNSVWTKIGSVTREQVYRAYNSTNLNPTFTGLTVNSSTTTQPLEQIIRVNPGQTVALTLTATDPDAGQALRFVSDVPDVVPGTTLQTLNATQARLTWSVPSTLPLGRYRLTVGVADNGCPTNASEVRTITFLVTNQVLATGPRRPLLLSASPNPFQSQVSFQVAKPQPVVVFDGLGRAIAHLKSRPDGTVTWQPAAAVAPGLYFARTADGKQLVRLVRE
ncbi:hypothetical protein SAMN06265337_2760 [Hymenobacter gelipurpurascens]|uniref:Por secretion system C-terminal sorting domain-containing protein n=1 Tax=Hymenobacter gelipurpurascens TaxID=89968 RepID=A0A212UA87_9BACT|nr:hypothetical protein [Hymenobacter gelipurpurascens]SNC75212.1 hypothetical protein SAMN06265337_2760 [Hymenobacter gelipurpurascens]